MFSKTHKKVLLVTGSVACGKSFFCKQINRKEILYIDLDQVVMFIYETNIDFKKKLLKIDPTFIENNEINKKNIKKAISQTPKILDFIEKKIYPILKNQLDLILKDSEHILIIMEVPLLFEKDFKVNFSYRSINVFCNTLIHKKRLNLRFGQSKNLFKNIILKRHYSQKKKSILSDEIINSGCNNRLKKLLIEVLLSKYLN